MLSQHLYILSAGQKWNTRLLKCYVVLTTWSELVSAVPLPVLGNSEMNTGELRDVGDNDLEGNYDAEMWDTDDAPTAGVLRDGTTHEHDHDAVPERWYPD